MVNEMANPFVGVQSALNTVQSQMIGMFAQQMGLLNTMAPHNVLGMAVRGAPPPVPTPAPPLAQGGQLLPAEELRLFYPQQFPTFQGQQQVQPPIQELGAIFAGQRMPSRVSQEIIERAKRRAQAITEGGQFYTWPGGTEQPTQDPNYFWAGQGQAQGKPGPMFQGGGGEQPYPEQEIHGKKIKTSIF